MGLLTKLANRFAGLKYATDARLFGEAIPDYFMSRLTPESGLIGIYRRDPTQSDLVQGIIRVLGDAVGSTPFVVMEKRGADEIVHYEHPLLDVLHRPTGTMTWMEFAVAIVDGLIGNGNVYLLPMSRTEMVLLDWRYMRKPQRNQMYYEWVNPWTSAYQRYGLGDLVHIRYQRAPDGINGQGPLRGAVLDELQSDALSRQYTMTNLRNRGVINFLLGPKDPNRPMTDEQATSLRRRLEAMYSGNNRGKLAVTP